MVHFQFTKLWECRRVLLSTRVDFILSLCGGLYFYLEENWKPCKLVTYDYQLAKLQLKIVDYLLQNELYFFRYLIIRRLETSQNCLSGCQCPITCKTTKLSGRLEDGTVARGSLCWSIYTHQNYIWVLRVLNWFWWSFVSLIQLMFLTRALGENNETCYFWVQLSVQPFIWKPLL